MVTFYLPQFGCSAKCFTYILQTILLWIQEEIY